MLCRPHEIAPLSTSLAEPHSAVKRARMHACTQTGHVAGAEGVRGFGIAFPEMVTDPAGHDEFAVGMWKFMRYVREKLLPPPPRPPAAA